MGEKQLQAFNEGVVSNTNLVREAVDANIAKQGDSSEALVATVNTSIAAAVKEMHASSTLLLSGFSDTREQWAAEQQQLASQFSGAIREELALLREDETKRGNDAVAHLSQL